MTQSGTTVAYRAIQALVWVFLPVAILVRFYDLSNPLVEPHPIRQSQTGLTIQQLAQGQATVMDYRSPFHGALWNFVQEFPLYQWMASFGVETLGVEISARLLSLIMTALGTLALFWIAEAWFGFEVAVWAAALSWITPFSIVFSRSCLPDPTASALCLWAIWFGHRYLFGEKPQLRFAVGCLIAGSLCSLTKVTTWYAPAGVFFVLLVGAALRNRISRPRALLIAAVLLIQLGTAIFWIRYTMGLRQEFGVLGRPTLQWIIGTPEQRISLTAWQPIMWSLFRGVLHDWMILPFAAAVAFGKKRAEVGVVLLVVLLAIVGPFNVRQFHDYYFVAELPWMVVVAAYGFTVIRRLPLEPQNVLCMGVLALFAYRLTNVDINVAPIFQNQRPLVAQAQRLKNLVTPEEVLYVEAPPEQWHLPLYSERLIVLSPYYNPARVQPVGFVFQTAQNLVNQLKEFSFLWVEGIEQETPTFRVREGRGHPYDPSKHLALGETRISKAELTTDITGIKSCLNPIQVQITSPEPLLLVTALDAQKTVTLPNRTYIHLPSRSDLGCRWNIEPSGVGFFPKSQTL